MHEWIKNLLMTRHDYYDSSKKIKNLIILATSTKKYLEQG